jgi:hypothetical protein
MFGWVEVCLVAQKSIPVVDVIDDLYNFAFGSAFSFASASLYNSSKSARNFLAVGCRFSFNLIIH